MQPTEGENCHGQSSLWKIDAFCPGVSSGAAFFNALSRDISSDGVSFSGISAGAFSGHAASTGAAAGGADFCVISGGSCRDFSAGFALGSIVSGDGSFSAETGLAGAGVPAPLGGNSGVVSCRTPRSQTAGAVLLLGPPSSPATDSTSSATDRVSRWFVKFAS